MVSVCLPSDAVLQHLPSYLGFSYLGRGVYLHSCSSKAQPLLLTASDLASITSHIHSWVFFLLWLHPFLLSGVISPLIPSSILGTYWPGEFLFQYPIICLFMGFSRQEYWSGLPFPSPVDHILSYLSTMTCPSWVAPRAWLSFIDLDKAVVLVWLDWLVSCEYGFSVSALWCPLATPTILLGFLLPWA